jgi:hypothetical protein
MTAEELMNQLKSDPDFVRQEAAREEKWRQRREASTRVAAPVVTDLNKEGFDGESIQSIVENHAPLPARAIDILLKWLQLLSEQDLEDNSVQAKLADSVARALSATTLSFDGRPLANCFERTNDEGLRWAIANTIALTSPHSIDAWLTEKLKHRYWGKTLRELGVQQ